ncbi:MAG: hypothetical protein IH849_12730 [Acidobacteria bacterium]|nr:hypothetical protein [Acidobacteriota bacterium]
MTRAEAAVFVGVSVSTIRRWETAGVTILGAPCVLRNRTEPGLILFVREAMRFRNVRPEVVVRAFTQELRELQALDEDGGCRVT